MYRPWNVEKPTAEWHELIDEVGHFVEVFTAIAIRGAICIFAIVKRTSVEIANFTNHCVRILPSFPIWLFVLILFDKTGIGTASALLVLRSGNTGFGDCRGGQKWWNRF